MVSIAPDEGLDERYLVQPVLKAMQVLRLVCEAAETRLPEPTRARCRAS